MARFLGLSLLVVSTFAAGCAVEPTEEDSASSSSSITEAERAAVPSVVVYQKHYAAVGDYLYTTNPREADGMYVMHGPAFRIYAGPFSDAVAIYRCRWAVNGIHFLSADPRCGGQLVDGRLGFLAARGPGLKPLTQCVAERPAPGVVANITRIYTSTDFCRPGSNFRAEGILGMHP